jgi:hypothetical protein
MQINPRPQFGELPQYIVVLICGRQIAIVQYSGGRGVSDLT